MYFIATLNLLEVMILPEMVSLMVLLLLLVMFVFLQLEDTGVGADSVDCQSLNDDTTVANIHTGSVLEIEELCIVKVESNIALKL